MPAFGFLADRRSGWLWRRNRGMQSGDSTAVCSWPGQIVWSCIQQRRKRHGFRTGVDTHLPWPCCYAQLLLAVYWGFTYETATVVSWGKYSAYLGLAKSQASSAKPVTSREWKDAKYIALRRMVINTFLSCVALFLRPFLWRDVSSPHWIGSRTYSLALLLSRTKILNAGYRWMSSTLGRWDMIGGGLETNNCATRIDVKARDKWKKSNTKNNRGRIWSRFQYENYMGGLLLVLRIRITSKVTLMDLEKYPLRKARRG